MKRHTAMVIKRNDKLLFIKRSLTVKSLPGIWLFPTGTIEPGESPRDTAIREAKEELNLDIISTKIISEIKLEGLDAYLIFVLCEAKNFDNIIIEQKEIEKIGFMSLDEFLDRFKDEEIGHGLRLIRKDRSLLDVEE